MNKNVPSKMKFTLILLGLLLTANQGSISSMHVHEANLAFQSSGFA
jgi:hypothetical protein